MKRIILLITIIILINNRDANAIRKIFYLGYSYSEEKINGKNIQNHSIGHEFFFSDFDIGSNVHCLGLNYKFGDNGNILTSHYLINPGYIKNLDILYVFMPTIGTNVSYNFDKKIWGIGPQVDLINIIFIVFKFNITYRYNIYFQADNSHEIGFTVSVSDYFNL
jgi:hypothetical protein